MKSIVIEPKGIRDSSNDFNPNHHRSVVVFNHSRTFSNAEAIGPQKSKIQVQLDQKNQQDDEVNNSDSGFMLNEDKDNTIVSEEASVSTFGHSDNGNKRKSGSIFAERLNKMKKELMP